MKRVMYRGTISLVQSLRVYMYLPLPARKNAAFL